MLRGARNKSSPAAAYHTPLGEHGGPLFWSIIAGAFYLIIALEKPSFSALEIPRRPTLMCILEGCLIVVHSKGVCRGEIMFNIDRAE